MAENDEALPRHQLMKRVTFELTPDDYERLEGIASREPPARYGASGVSPHQLMRRVALDMIEDDTKKRGKKK